MTALSGIDSLRDIEPNRWDHHDYFDGDPSTCIQTKKTYARHTSTVEGLELFDFKFFGISLAESKGMDPHQRNILETGYAAFHDAGFVRKSLMRSWTGVFIGGTQGEWSYVPSVDSSAMGGTTASLAITSNRMSYILGLMGPSYSIDLDGAASLVAIIQNGDANQHGKLQQNMGLSGGVNFALAPQAMMFASWAEQNSWRGRCLTFDSSADGYARGEGAGAVVLAPLVQQVDGKRVVSNEEHVLGILSGSKTAASGKTASFGAPSGAVDQGMICETIRRAEINALDVDYIEADGVGQVLRDAVEVSALVKSYRSVPTNETLGIGAFKSHHGDPKHTAGIGGFLKLLAGMRRAVMVPTQHLRKISPYLHNLDESSVFIGTEALAYRLPSTFAAMTAKNYSGLNSHGIFYSSLDQSTSTPPRKLFHHAKDELLYWPGGGGFLEAEQRPTRGCSIAGTWTNWALEPMELIGRGNYISTFTLGPDGFERFHICLDGDANKVLHPSSTAGRSDCQVFGPDSHANAFTSAWQVDTRSQVVAVPVLEGTDESTGGGGEPRVLSTPSGLMRLYKVPSSDEGEPGDRFQVKLEFHGKYRMVSWGKARDDDEDAKKEEMRRPRYYVASTGTMWQLAELAADPRTPGLFGAQVTSSSNYGLEFQIVVNGDFKQAIYPEEPLSRCGASRTLGPDECGSGSTWYLPCRAGSRFWIELLRTTKEGIPITKVTCKPVTMTGSDEGPGISPVPRVEHNAPYYIIGSWDYYAQPLLMTQVSETRWIFRRRMPDKNTESFQLLRGGYRTMPFGPSREDANPYSDHQIKGPDAPYDRRYWWTVGLHSRDEEIRGFDYEVVLQLSAAGLPSNLTWGRPSDLAHLSPPSGGDVE